MAQSPQDSPSGPARGPAPARPAQVTYAGWAVMLGSLALVVSAFQQVATLHTLDTRTAVERLITEQPTGLAITVEGWLMVLKVLGMVCGACAAAGAILGWQTLQRSRPARTVLLILAVPLVVTGLATGPFFAVLVAGAVITLWLPTANSWFAPGHDGRGSDVPPPSGQQPPASGQPGPWSQPGPLGQSGPPSQTGQTGQTAQPYGVPQYPGAPLAPYGGEPTGPQVRPGAVTAAAVITFVLAGISAVLGAVVALVGATAAQDMMDELGKRGYDTGDFTVHELATGFAVLGSVLAVVSIGAIVAAVFVLRRAHGARVVLTVLAGLTIAVSLAGITSGISLVTLVGAAVTIVLLYRRDSNAWFAGRGR